MRDGAIRGAYAMRIKFVVEPARDVAEMHSRPPQRFDSFMDALARCPGVDMVRVSRCLKNEVSSEGVILLYSDDPLQALAECSQSSRDEMAPRLMLIEPPYPFVDPLLEAFSLAGAIDALAYISWGLAEWGKSQAGAEACGLYGLRDVSRIIGSACQRQSPRYGYLTSASGQGLPRLLVDYLQALAAGPFWLRENRSARS